VTIALAVGLGAVSDPLAAETPPYVLTSSAGGAARNHAWALADNSERWSVHSFPLTLPGHGSRRGLESTLEADRSQIERVWSLPALEGGDLGFDVGPVLGQGVALPRQHP